MSAFGLVYSLRFSVMSFGRKRSRGRKDEKKPEDSKPIIDVSDVMPLTFDMKKFLRRRLYAWPMHGDIWMSVADFDSRTIQWFDMLNWMCHSQLADQSVGILAYKEVVRREEDRPPEDIYKGPFRDKYANGIISSDPLCIAVVETSLFNLACKMKPAHQALKFVIGLFTHPQPDQEEARYPTGCYITTLNIWFFDLQICLRVYRER